MARRTRELFATIHTVGGLLPPELLKRIAEGDSELPGLAPEAYHLEKTERIGEAINRAWNRVRGAWEAFREARAKLGEGAPDAGLTRDRWLLVLFQELGFGRLPAARGIEIDGERYPVSHVWHHTPIHLVGYRTELDRRTPGVAGAARRSPHSLVQELLNRSAEHQWGFVSNGLLLRLLRDNASLTRQAFVEFDLEAMLEGEVYADFVLLFLLCHQSRVEAERPDSCWLEQWVAAARDQGTRALERLRGGVEAAIEALGHGFLAHPRNGLLREALRSGALDKQEYYRELLRLVYRLLFLLVTEDRGLLLDPDAKLDAKRRYLDHYSTARLRRLASRRRGGPHPDLWQSLRLVMAKLGDDSGCPDLALPPLGSFLWSSAAVPHLTDAELANEHLLAAMRALAFTAQERLLRPVDWRNLDTEELGSVYESLLELHPEVDAGAPAFSLSTAVGHERKTTGSYYTPDSLVQCLLDTALDPVLDDAVKKADPEAALLALTVCDPACGSGHFLIAAARRMARRLAQVRTGDAEPDPDALQHALRDVIGKCVYGVDVNPMAVELCKVSLWLEAIEPGRPLSFLDHQIQCGNSLLGTTPALLAMGIPDDAFEPIAGDDKSIAAALKKRNKAERKTAGQKTMFAAFVHSEDVESRTLADQAASFRNLADDTIGALHLKEEAFARLAASNAYARDHLLADAWCAAFVWPKMMGAPDAPTSEVLRRLGESATMVSATTRAEIQRIAAEYRFFHWHLAFPEVLRADKQATSGSGQKWNGGFDVVLGNPPWERVKIQEKEFFGSRVSNPDRLIDSASRDSYLQEIERSDPTLWRAWLQATRRSESAATLIRLSGRFPKTSIGDLNFYPVFAELADSIISRSGFVALLLPQGIATDKSYAGIFRDALEGERLVAVRGFVNERMLFPAVMHNVKFCIFTFAGPSAPGNPRTRALFSFNAESIAESFDAAREHSLSASDINLLNPETGTCPIFTSGRSATILARVYDQIPTVSTSGHRIGYGRTLHMKSAGRQFLPRGSGHVPVLESKMIYQYNHRFAGFQHLAPGEHAHILPQSSARDLVNPTYVGASCYEIPRDALAKEYGDALWKRWRLVYRRITSLEVARTVVACVVPNVGISDSLMIVDIDHSDSLATLFLLACFNSFSFDFSARCKQGGRNLSQYIYNQLPIPSRDVIDDLCSWDLSMRLIDWVRCRALELTYSSWDLSDLASDCGYQGPPFRWDEVRRPALRAELDAAFLHLYRIGRNDAEHILDSFWVIREREEEAHGEYRTKRVILEIYDALQQAIDSGEPYVTRLDPPPADPRVAHPPRRVA